MSARRGWREIATWVVVAAIATAGTAAADTGGTVVSTGAQNPAPIHTFEGEGGIRWTLGADDHRERWFRILYKGSLLRGEGTPFKDATSLDLSVPSQPEAAGDRNEWTLRFEDGTATIGGGLFEAENVRPITLRGLEKLDLRGAGYVGGDTDGHVLRIAIGVESHPLRVPGLAKTGASNWLVLGLNGERQEATDAQAGDDDLGLITFRSFLGKAFGWRKSADVGATAGKLEEELLEQAPTYEKGKALAAKIKQDVPANQRTKVQQRLIDTVQDFEEGESWEAAIRATARGVADQITDQPTVAVYAEASGWQTVTGDPQGTRFKALATITIDDWFLPTRDDVFVRLRYENGYERAVPTVRLNQLMASLSLRF